MIVPVQKRITTNATTTAIATSCVISQIVIACAVAGSSWTLKIQDKASSPFVLIPAFTLIVPPDGYPNVVLNLASPIPMSGGIDIVTAGGSGTREVAVWMILGTN